MGGRVYGTSPTKPPSLLQTGGEGGEFRLVLFLKMESINMVFMLSPTPPPPSRVAATQAFPKRETFFFSLPLVCLELLFTPPPPPLGTAIIPGTLRGPALSPHKTKPSSPVAMTTATPSTSMSN